MASAEQYAKWCMQLIDGEDHMVDDIFAAMLEDGFADEDNEWLIEDDDE
jgi:hypothetical protein